MHISAYSYIICIIKVNSGHKSYRLFIVITLLCVTCALRMPLYYTSYKLLVIITIIIEMRQQLTHIITVNTSCIIIIY